MAEESEKKSTPKQPPTDGSAPAASTRPADEGLKPETPPPPSPDGQAVLDQSPDHPSDDSTASKDPIERVTVAVEDIDEDLDPAWLEVIKQMARDTPETRWRHSSHFSQDEDRIIAAGITSLTSLYKIAQTLRCDRRTLQKHIESDPLLSQMLADQNQTRREKIQEGIDQLVEIHHPNVIMWAAEHQLSDIYGKDKQMNEEDDSVLVIGEIPESSLSEADAILAAAAETPPEVGLTAMLDERVTSTPVPQTPALPQPPSPTAPQAPSQTPPPPAPPAQPQPAPQPSAPSVASPTATPATPPLPQGSVPPEQQLSDPDEGNYVDDGSYGGFNDGYNDFGGGGWLS